MSEESRNAHEAAKLHWGDELKSLQKSREKLLQNAFHDAERFFGLCLPYFPLITEQLGCYQHYLERPTSLSKEETKKIVLATRSALRLALCCLSVTEDPLRGKAQTIATQNCWHEVLSQILSHCKGDATCRLYGARLFSNLLTSNSQTSALVLSTLPFTPSDELISKILCKSVADGDDFSGSTISPSWLGFIVSASQSANREAMSAIVAALYNSISATKICKDIDFMHLLATSSLLVCTLLRQFLTVQSIKKTMGENFSFDAEEPLDSSSEWILLLIEMLCRHGKLRSMYRSISTATSDMVLPEHVLLLWCVCQLVVEHGSNAMGLFGQNDSEIKESTIFLAELYSKVHHRVPLLMKEESCVEDVQLSQAVMMKSVDILAEFLGTEGNESAATRQAIGEESSLIQDAAQNLGEMIDFLLVQNSEKKVRDITIVDDNQKILTSLVRLFGNLCYECRHNQDLMRTTVVLQSSASLPSECLKQERNLLHVLLSCTSFSWACFTLREWAVVAVRNALKDNSANQECVAKLEAQEPVQSAALADMGVRVDLDPKGNVSVKALDVVEEEAAERAELTIVNSIEGVCISGDEHGGVLKGLDIA
jgi:hypothetical protein